jgi:hypothetical protein
VGVIACVDQDAAAPLEEAVDHVGGVRAVRIRAEVVVVVDLDGVHGPEVREAIRGVERQVVQARMQQDDEGVELARAADGLGRIVRRRRLEVERKPDGGHPVGRSRVPRPRAELGREDGGEADRAQPAGVRDPPAVALLEVIGQRDEVVARVAVGGRDLAWRPQSVGSVGVTVEVAPPEASVAIREQISCHRLRVNTRGRALPGFYSDSGRPANASGRRRCPDRPLGGAAMGPARPRASRVTGRDFGESA